MKKEYICIVCPKSCRLTVEEIDGQIKVSGNTCKRGHDHGVGEYTAPLRMLTTTVALTEADSVRIPVVSSCEIPKEKIKDCLAEIYQMEVKAPIRCGEVLINNICGTGADICASRTILKKGE